MRLNALAGMGLVSLLAVSACSPSEPASTGGAAALRRLTEGQYRQTIADVFGADIKVAGRFEPDNRKDGLLAVGTTAVTVTPTGFEQYDSMGRAIAAQIVDEKRRDTLLGCQPADAKKADEACATAVLTKYGRLLWRRPLDAEELGVRVKVANAAADALGDFYQGIQLSLASLLDAPEFLFRKDVAAGPAATAGAAKIDGYSKATRLSFLLWNTSPDAALLDAAAAGRLDSKEGLRAEIDRMMASPRLEEGVRAFFTDFLGFDRLDTLSKDQVIYPKYSQKVVNNAKEQTLRTLVDHLLVQKADYRDLFTTRQTFINRTLGVVYDVPVKSKADWERLEFAKDDPHAGLLTQISFTMTHAHPGRSSATLRGKAIRELLLCEKVPDPPANVNFAVVQDTTNPNFRTARDRLTAHRTDPTCSGCHKVIDPIGLALENFDGLGQMRLEENGAVIDTSGDINGQPFKDAAGLGKALRDNPSTSSCVVDSLYRFAVGRNVADGEKQWLAWLEKSFARDGHRLPDLLRHIAESDTFYTIAAPAPEKTASAPHASAEEAIR